jgi:hypothetical protein
MIGHIKKFIIIVSISLCYARDYFTPPVMYKDHTSLEFEAQFPVSRGFDVALHCQSYANLTGFEGCSSPIRLPGNFSSPYKYLFTSDCVGAQIVYYITTTGKVANITAIDETSNKAGIMISVWLNLQEKNQINVMAKKISFETLKTLVDPAVVNITQMTKMWFIYSWRYGIYGWDEALNLKIDVKPQITSVVSSPTTSLPPRSTTLDGVRDIVDDRMIVAIPSGMHTTNDSIIFGLWLLAIGTVSASNMGMS